MNIVNEYEEEGYKIIEYNNGTIVKELILESKQESQETLSNIDLYMLKIESDIEYLKCIAEINI